MTSMGFGVFCFGLVIGWITYRMLRRSTAGGWRDFACVIGVVGGAATTSLFPASDVMVAAYGLGLAIGFFSNLIVSLALAARGRALSPVGEWLGELPDHPHGRPMGESGLTIGPSAAAGEIPRTGPSR